MQLIFLRAKVQRIIGLTKRQPDFFREYLLVGLVVIAARVAAGVAAGGITTWVRLRIRLRIRRGGITTGGRATIITALLVLLAALRYNVGAAMGT